MKIYNNLSHNYTKLKNISGVFQKTIQTGTIVWQTCRKLFYEFYGQNLNRMLVFYRKYLYNT